MNESGINPIEHKVVVMPEQVSATSQSGLIHKPQELLDAEELAQVEGVIVAKSAMSFSYGKKGDGEIDYWAGDIPKVGDKVQFSKYAGIMRDGVDGKRYRIINDKDVMAILGG